VQVLEAMRDQHDDPKLREFASTLLPEIEADNRVLRSIAEKIGSGPSVAKKAGGWLLEKFARLKLGHTGSRNFEMFESLGLQRINIGCRASRSRIRSSRESILTREAKLLTIVD
jgi:hypothetical protein